ncbi:hypothetical protein H6G64_34150 [Calothrix sp. FACHB-156]|nr:hypothetical protein [Calothrix sp. FACHB-156]
MENHLEISQDLETYRKQAADKFIEEFMKIWQQQGFRLDDLIEAIAHYLHKHNRGNDEIDVCVRKLDEASQQYRDIKKYDRLLQESNPD